MNSPALAVAPQPAPAPGSQVVYEAILVDLNAVYDDLYEPLKKAFQARFEFGQQKHGSPLMAHNGRDALADAFQESLDLVFYLAQLTVEYPAHVGYEMLYRDTLALCINLCDQIERRSSRNDYAGN
jgi:hypothetical protein